MDRMIGVRLDWLVTAHGVTTATAYPERLRKICFRDQETKKTLIFISNDFMLPAHVIAAPYKGRWQVQLFFKSQYLQEHRPIIQLFKSTNVVG